MEVGEINGKKNLMMIFRKLLYISKKKYIYRIHIDLEKSWKTPGILKKCNLSLNCPGIVKKSP